MKNNNSVLLYYNNNDTLRRLYIQGDSLNSLVRPDDFILKFYK